MEMKGRIIMKGKTQAEALVTSQPISFYGGVDPKTSQILEKGHELQGKLVKGKILVFPTGKGSTVGSYTLYRLKFNGLAPAAIVNTDCETITAVGCIIAEIPCVDQISIEQMETGMSVAVDGEMAVVEVLEDLGNIGYGFRG